MNFYQFFAKFQMNKKALLSSLAACIAISISTPSMAVSLLKNKKTPFLYDITTFTTTLNPPVKEEMETISIPQNKLRTRLVRSETDLTVEPLSIAIGPRESQLTAIAEKISAVGRVEELIAFLRKARDKAQPAKSGSSLKIVYITREAFPFVDPRALSDLYAKSNLNIEIDTHKIKSDKILRKEFLSQIAPFFTKKERRKIHRKISQGEPIFVSKDLLPEFAKKMVGKYIVFRGPNCFHAALAFHSPKLTSSTRINVKIEKNYHRAMINYDELWRAINQNFYEINPDEQSLKYGDMVVFFDVPEDQRKIFPVDYKTIRHATTYLFGGYTFSKGSKSPNSPYTVRELAEEWHTWKRYTKNLGVKVFRRSSKNVSLYPPRDSTDWMY